MAISRPAVLFVCLGNICRSPLAEAAFRLAAEMAGLAAIADSAGTGDWHVGEPPDARACDTARRHGCEIHHYAARQVESADFDRFTHIYALDHSNLAALTEIAPPDHGAKLGLLLDIVAGREGQGVADPYFGDAAGFEVTWADVTIAADALVAKLIAEAD
jgi:protein-tyrosine phosphatase